MKKLIITAAIAMASIATFSADSYHVYDIKMNVKTTKAKGSVEKDCGTYTYRDKGTSTIKGVIGGCGCGAIIANGVCQNAIIYMWDDTLKLPITNITTRTGWKIQRIGKNENVVEHFCQITAVYGYDDEYKFNVTLSGFGSYSLNKNDDNMSRVSSISGNFAGYATAPFYYKAGKCTACSEEPDIYEQTTATALCETCSEASYAEKTPFYGTYTVKYNSSKSGKISKNGPSTKNFGLPSYVGILDYVATNIGE